MESKELISSGGNINITISVNDMQNFARPLIMEARENLAQYDDENLAVPEVFKLLGVSKSTLWVLIKNSNLLHQRRFGRKTLYLNSEVQAFASNSNFCSLEEEKYKFINGALTNSLMKNISFTKPLTVH